MNVRSINEGCKTSEGKAMNTEVATMRGRAESSGEGISEAASHMSASWVDREAYPFEDRWMTLKSGARMHYLDEGSGEPLLFVHGTPTWSFEWRHLVRGLRSRFRCIAPDHLGFGLSDRPRGGSYTPEWHATNLAEFVERLGLEGFTLVVHDYGGPIGLPLALDGRGRVKRLVIFNTWMWSLKGDSGVERAHRIVGGKVGRFLYRRANFSLRVITPSAFADRRKLTPRIHGQYLAPFADIDARETVLWALARALMESDAHYDALWSRRGQLATLPALIVWGMKDPAFRPHQLERWRKALPAAEVLDLPVGHWPQEEAPEEVVEAVSRFLHQSAPAR
jgi:haloalkane dehalogenase